MNGKHIRGSRNSSRSQVSGAEKTVRGFTLIEVLISLSILLVAAVITVPVVQSSLANYQLRSAVSSMTGTIQATRYQAISSGYPYRLSFTKSSKTFQLSSDPGITGTFANVGGAIPFTSSSDPTTLGVDTTLQFGGGGSVKATTGTMVLVLTRASKSATITVSPYGNVNVVYAP